MAAGIVDNKDIIDIGAYLSNKEKTITSMDHLLGPELFTIPQYISSSRAIMFTNHLKQMVSLNHPEFPRVFTNYENVFGDLSSSIYKAKDDCEVVKIVPKFEWNPKHLYVVFLFDKKNKKYFCLTKKIAEELTEKFGYGFNNTALDALEEGQKIHKGDILWKSNSYDEDNNYCYGVNALTVYLIDNRTIEDAAICSESFAKRMEAKEVETIKISLNDNDLLLNLYGDNEHHKGFPDIGVKVNNKILCSKRRIDNFQLLFDMKRSNLLKSNPLNDKQYYSKGEVMDVDIYCNQQIEDIPDIPANEQIIQYLKNQKRYWTEILDVCQEIADSGCEYDDDIGFLLGRAKNYLNPDYKWKDNDSVFNNIIMEISVQRDVPLNVGYKVTGRYGNKSVIAKIIPDDEMPMLANGRRVDFICNALGVINRLNPAQIMEVSINFIADNIIEKMKEISGLKGKEQLLWKFMKYFDERHEYTRLKDYYSKLSTADKRVFFEDIFTNGIYVNLPPISASDVPLFDVIHKLYQEFPWIKPYECYINKWGRKIKIMNPLIAGEQYIIRLKQTAKKNFSARSTGYLSQKGLPDKSNKAKHNQQLYSTTPIKIGRDENNNLGIGLDPYFLAKFHLFYRSSPAARREVEKLYTKNPLNFKKFKVKKRFKNRNVEILNAYFKSSGRRLNYGFDGLRLNIFDDDLHTIMYKGKMYVDTYEGMRKRLLEQRYRKEFNQTLHVGSKEWIESEYKKFADNEYDKIKDWNYRKFNKPKKDKKKGKPLVIKFNK